MASRAFRWAYSTLNQGGISTCSRHYQSVGPVDFENSAPLSLEMGLPPTESHVIAVSIASELQLPVLLRMLINSGIEPEKSKRGKADPPVIIGGPMTRSNPSVLTGIGDITVFGDGEPAMERLLELLAQGVTGRAELLAAMASSPGVLFEDKVDEWQPCVAAAKLPLFASITTPESTFGNSRLVEVVRGCPRACAFCVSTRHSAPLRMAAPGAIIDALPAGDRKLGLIGACIGDYPHLSVRLAGLA